MVVAKFAAWEAVTGTRRFRSVMAVVLGGP